MTVTWTKLRDGTWGLRGAGLVRGQLVTVTKKNGESERVTVGEVLWTGQGVALARASGGASKASTGARSAGTRRGGCRGCGGPIVHAREHRAMEGYCGSCAFDEFDC